MTLAQTTSYEESEVWADAAIEALSYIGETCSLDRAELVRERGEVLSDQEMGDLLGVSHQRAHQETRLALRAYVEACQRLGLDARELLRGLMAGS